MKKFLCIIFAVILSVTLLAGCGTATQAPSGGGTVSTSNAGNVSTDSFTLYMTGKTFPVDLDGPITQEIMKQSNLYWKEIFIDTGGDLQEQINLKLASGDFDNIDAFVLGANNPIWGQLITEGIFRPLDHYFEDVVNYPNLAKIDKRILDYWRMEDGHIYFVPSAYEKNPEYVSNWNSGNGGLWIRKDLAEQAGQTLESVTDLTNYEAFLYEMVSTKDKAGRDIIPLSLGKENFPGLKYVLSMFGVKSDFNTDEKGEAIPDYKLPGYKDALKWLNRMHNDGILDPETTYQKEDLYRNKIGAIRFASLLYDGWDELNVAVLSEYGYDQSNPATYSEMEKIGFPTEWYRQVSLPKQPGVTRAPFVFISPFGSRGTGITMSCKNPDAIMKGLDWFQNDEAYYLMEWGTIEMGNYDLVGGIPQQRSPEETTDWWWNKTPDYMADVTKHGYWWWKDIGGPATTQIPWIESPWIPNNAEYVRAEMNNLADGLVIINPVVNRVRNKMDGICEKMAPVQNDIKLQYNARLILANPSEFDSIYDEYLNEMKVRGRDEETITEFNEQFRNYLNTPAGKAEISIKGTVDRNVFGEGPLPTGIVK